MEQDVKKETITVDGVEYIVDDLSKELQLKIRQYVICQQRVTELVNAFNTKYDECMTEKSILDAAMAKYSAEISVEIVNKETVVESQ